MITPGDGDARPVEKKIPKPVPAKPLTAPRQQPTMMPEMEREASGKYQIPKKAKSGGMGREKPGIDKDEQAHAPMTKYSKIESRPGIIHRQEEPQNPNFVDMQGGPRPQMGMQQRYGANPHPMQGPGPNRGDRYPYQQHNFEEAECQFSDDESKNANFDRGLKPKPHYQDQFSQMQQNKYPHQMQGNIQQQPQMRDQRLGMQHHPQNFQQPPQLLNPSGFHPGQSPMGTNQYPAKHQMQNMPMNYPQMGPGPGMLQNQMGHSQYSHDQRIYQATSPRNRQQFGGPDAVPQQQQQFINKQPITGANQPHEREKLMEMKEIFQSSLKQQPKEFEPIPSTRMDSFPEPTTISARKSSEVYDPSGALIFKTLLSHMKQELPYSIKSRYQQKLGSQESLSSMMNRFGF